MSLYDHQQVRMEAPCGRILTEEQAGRILLCIPTRGNDLRVGLHLWLSNMSQRYPEMTHLFIENKLCDFSTLLKIQEHMLSEAGKEYTHAFIIDSDIVPTATTIEELYLAEKDVIAVPAWFWDSNRNMMFLATNEASVLERDNDLIENKKGIVKLDHISFVAVLIHRKVFEAFGEEPMFVEYGRYGQPVMTSDVCFSRKCKEKGIDQWVNYDIKGVKHFGYGKISDELMKNIRNVGVIQLTTFDQLNKHKYCYLD